MSDNKPLLFINSAQSGEFKDKNQYVYDSRFAKKSHNMIPEVKKKKENQEESKKTEETEVRMTEEENNHEEIIEIEQEEKLVDDVKMKKLFNKIDLLEKRARLERYVLVNVVTEEEEREGYFIDRNDKEIVLSIDEEEVGILINDIIEIFILKV